jgi:hypothetical protein
MIYLKHYSSVKMSGYRGFPVADRRSEGYHSCCTETWPTIREEINKNRSYATYTLSEYMYREDKKANGQMDLLGSEKRKDTVYIPTKRLMQSLPDDVTQAFLEELDEVVANHVYSLRPERVKRLNFLKEFVHTLGLEVEYLPPKERR